MNLLLRHSSSCSCSSSKVSTFRERGRCSIALAVALFLLTEIAQVGGAVTNASSLTDDELLRIKFEQMLSQQISLERGFRDDAGQVVQLGDYFRRKPVVLIMGYYGCPMLCSLVLNGAVEALQDLRATPGTDFEIVFVSIDPTELPELAAAKKRTYLKRYGRNASGDGWHFLTGDEATTKQLAAEVGFRYAYDGRLKEYAHPSGLIVLTPDGRVSRYLFGVSFSAKELDEALKEADRKRIGSPIGQLVLLCFHYRPLTGKYAGIIMGVVRASGVITLLGLGWILIGHVRRRRRSGTGIPPVSNEHLAREGRQDACPTWATDRGDAT